MPLQGSLFGQSLYQAEAQAPKDNLIETILGNEFDPSSLDGLSKNLRVKYQFDMKTRDEHLKKLKDPSIEFDLLIIGGGANGAGVVLDAASRGLNCAVIDSFDFAAGTSSKSTKMAHGGIRYFQQMCLLEGDPIESYRLLKDTLNERNYFLQAAPYLVKELKLLIPSPSLLTTLFWHWPGAFGYHLLYLRQLMSSNYQSSVNGPSFMRKATLRKEYPNLHKLHGQYGAVMSETQMHDSRMNLNCLFTAAVDEYIPGMKGATLANYVELKSLIKDENGKIIGGMCIDKMDPEGKEFPVKAKVVVNCAGVHADEIRKMDKADVENRIVPSRGTHLIFKKGLGIKENTGIIIPMTGDGRLIFIINYFGHPMVGTTDVVTETTHYSEPSQKEIEFICNELKPFFGEDYDFKNNLLSSWAGLRPLVKADTVTLPVEKASNSIRDRAREIFQSKVRWLAFKLHPKEKKATDTASISRNHVIEVSENGLVSLMGGKWTSFRSQGEETVDKILKDNPDVFKDTLSNATCQTLNFNFIGSYSRAQLRDGFIQNPVQVFQQYEDFLVFEHKVPRDIAKHLIREYGTASLRVVEIGKIRNNLKRLHEDYPFIESEVLYSIQSEMAVKPNDIICRRVPVSFIDY